jgi:hypothetical protein
MEKISWTNHVENEAFITEGRGGGNILHTIKRRKTNGIGHILHKNCFLKHVIEEKTEGSTEVMVRQGRRYTQLLGALKEKRG